MHGLVLEMSLLSGMPRKILRLFTDNRLSIPPIEAKQQAQNGERPKLCFVSLYSYPLFNAACVSPFGGSEVRVARIAKALARRGRFDVSMIVFDHGQAEVEIRDDVTLYAWRGRPCPLKVKPPPAAEAERCAPAGPVPGHPGPMVEWARKHIPRFVRNMISWSIIFVRKAISWGIVLPRIIAGSFIREVRAIARYLDLQVKRFQAIGRIGPHLVLRRNVMMYDKVNADIYVLPGNNEMAAEMTLFCAKRNKINVMLAGSDIDFDPEIKNNPSTVIHYGVPGYLKLYAIQQTRAFVVQSETQAGVLRRTFGKSAVVVRNPMDISMNYPRVGEPSRILWVGKSDKIKRPDLVLDLAAAMRDVSFMLIMTLSDPAIHQQNCARGVALGNVSIADYVAFDEVEQYFADAKVLVNTSQFEGFPNAFLQAAKYGVPIVSLRVDPGAMLSRHGCGYVCDGSMETMVTFTRQLLQDSSAYAQMSANCREYVRRYHDVNVIAEQYEDVFLTLAPGQSTGSTALI